MEIFPRVSLATSFRKMTRQGFYVTPFKLGDFAKEADKEKEADRVLPPF